MSKWSIIIPFPLFYFVKGNVFIFKIDVINEDIIGFFLSLFFHLFLLHYSTKFMFSMLIVISFPICSHAPTLLARLFLFKNITSQTILFWPELGLKSNTIKTKAKHIYIESMITKIILSFNIKLDKIIKKFINIFIFGWTWSNSLLIKVTEIIASLKLSFIYEGIRCHFFIKSISSYSFTFILKNSITAPD